MAYALEMSPTNVNAPRAKVVVHRVLNIDSLAALGHALLDVVTERTGRLTDRP